MASNERNSGTKLIENLRRQICLQCGAKHIAPFFTIEQEVQPPSEYWHAIIAVCAECNGGQLERAYHDSSEWDEAFDQTEWYLLDKDSIERLDAFIQQKSADRNVRKKFSPCPAPLSPKCLCGVHWQLTEAAKRLEPLSDDELRNSGSVVASTFSLNDAGMPRFERSNR